MIPYRYPASRNQYPASRLKKHQVSLDGNGLVNPKNIILKAIVCGDIFFHDNVTKTLALVWPLLAVKFKILISIGGEEPTHKEFKWMRNHFAVGWLVLIFVTFLLLLAGLAIIWKCWGLIVFFGGISTAEYLLKNMEQERYFQKKLRDWGKQAIEQEIKHTIVRSVNDNHSDDKGNHNVAFYQHISTPPHISRRLLA